MNKKKKNKSKNTSVLPKYIEKSWNNLDEINDSITDFEWIDFSIDINKTILTCLGVVQTMTNKNGEKFNIIVTDCEFMNNEVWNRMKYSTEVSNDIRDINEYVDKIHNYKSVEKMVKKNGSVLGTS